MSEMAGCSNSMVTDARKAKRKRDSFGSHQNGFASQKKLREGEEQISNKNILNSLDTSEVLDESIPGRKGKGKRATAAGKKTEAMGNETILTEKEDIAAGSKRRRRGKDKVVKAATTSDDLKNAVIDAAAVAEEESGDKTCEDSADQSYKEQANYDPLGVDDLAAHEKSLPVNSRKHGRLSLKRKEEVEGPNVVEMLLKVKLDQGLKVKPEPGAVESSVKNEKSNNVSAPPVAPSLVNLGNTCFLNSVLQVFYYTPSFLENLMILNSEISVTEKDLATVASIESKLNIAGHSCRSWKLVRNLNELLLKMKKMEMLIAERQCKVPSPISPSDLLDTLQSLNSLFVGGQQQDAHELLRCLLAFIQEAVYQLNCCRTRFRGLLDSNSPLIADCVKSGKTCVSMQGMNGATDKLKMHDGFRENLKSDVDKQTKNKKNSVEAKKIRKQPRNRSKLKLNEGLTKNIDQPNIEKKNTTVKESISQVSPQTLFKCETSAAKGSLKAATVSSNSLLTKSSIMSYFGAANKPRTLGEIAPRTELISDFVESICQGKMEQETRCLECEQVTRSVEDFQDLALPVKKVSTSRMRHNSSDAEDEEKTEDAEYSWILKVVDEVERLDSDNKFWCEGCVHHTEAERYICYTGAPDVLTIQLKRFAAFSGLFGGFTKTMDCVSVPLHLPCLEHTCRMSGNSRYQHRYELYAVLSHSGISLSSGHYITYIRAPPSSVHQACPCGVTSCPNSTCGKQSGEVEEHKECPVWYECDDEVVTLVSQCQFVAMLASDSATTPYILFYEKRQL